MWGVMFYRTTTVVAESIFFQNYFAKNYLGCAWSSNLKLCFANRGNLAKDFLLKEFFQFSEFCGCRITFLSKMKTSRPVARDWVYLIDISVFFLLRQLLWIEYLHTLFIFSVKWYVLPPSRLWREESDEKEGWNEAKQSGWSPVLYRVQASKVCAWLLLRFEENTLRVIDVVHKIWGHFIGEVNKGKYYTAFYSENFI